MHENTEIMQLLYSSLHIGRIILKIIGFLYSSNFMVAFFVPENIHTLPWKAFWFEPPPPISPEISISVQTLL